MVWSKVDEDGVPTNRPLLVRTAESEDAIVAFLSKDGLWYSGGALVQNSTTLLSRTPMEWCEPGGDGHL